MKVYEVKDIQEALHELYDRIETLNAKIDSVDKNVNSKSREAYTRSKEYTDVTAITHNKHILSLQGQLETLKNKKSTVQKIKEWITSIHKIKITVTKGK